MGGEERENEMRNEMEWGGGEKSNGEGRVCGNGMHSSYGMDSQICDLSLELLAVYRSLIAEHSLITGTQG